MINSQKPFFGTDGIRGHADSFPFTAEALECLGYAIGQWLLTITDLAQPTLLLGRDTRISGERIRNHLLTGLQSLPIKVLDAGIVPTPLTHQLVQYSPTLFSCALIISASHNPFYDNGIKLFVAEKGKLTDSDEAQILSNFVAAQQQVIQASHKNFCYEPCMEAKTMYQKHLTTLLPANFLAGKTVVLDNAHGATYQLAPEIVRSYGATVYSIGSSPDGKNINDCCGSLHLEILQKAVLNYKADIGFAFDGDGDRVIMVNREGIICDGDDILYILKEAFYANESVVVGTTMSNSGLESALTKQGCTFIRTPVGDRYINAALHEKHALLGGEASGHIIMRDYLSTGDGIFTALRLMQAMSFTENWTTSTFVKFAQSMKNISVSQRKDLTQDPFASLINGYQKSLLAGRLVVRYSGTEPLLRIMVEAQTAEQANSVVHNLAQDLKQAFEQS